MIIFPQGAVVRLSATVTQGELVVLTNKRTGADVICRVTSVKTQPGIQNYVHLEFTQRALDYWEEAPVSQPANAGSKPQDLKDSPASPAPPAPTPINSAYRTASSPAQPAAKPSVLAAEITSPVASLPKVTPLADVTTAGFEKASGETEPVQELVSEISAPPVLVQKQPRIMPSRTPRLQPFEPVQQEKNGSKAIILFAVAAVVLLAMGAVGGAIFLRRDRGPSLAQQLPSSLASAAPATVAMPSQSEAPIANAPARTNSAEPSPAATVKSSAVETPVRPTPIRAAVEQPKLPVEAPKTIEVQPQPAPVTHPAINVGKISAPVVRASQLNSSAPPPILPEEGNAMPSIVTETATHGDALAAAQPVAPPPTKGGQLQQPKLLASVAAVYPPDARARHVQGDVIIDALIDTTGKVAATKVISGNPLLQGAAADSLRLWKYQPAHLNGQAIPIHINVTITFHLQ